MKRVSLKRNKENILAMQHPWIFSGALLTEGELEDGAWVEIVDRNQRVVATGHYQNHSIAVRILAFGTIPDKEAFYRLRVQEAFQLRRRLGLIRPDSNIFRLIHGEGDLLPGLIIDVYGSTAVIQCHSIGMHLDVPVSMPIPIRMVAVSLCSTCWFSFSRRSSISWAASTACRG